MNAKQEIPTPVQNNIVKPARPNSVVAPNIQIHVITDKTKEYKLEQNDVYIGYTWDEYINNIKFKRDVLQYIKEQNKILDYYESTVDDLNGNTN